MSEQNLPMAFGALLAGGLLLRKGVAAVAASFTDGGASSGATASVTTAPNEKGAHGFTAAANFLLGNVGHTGEIATRLDAMGRELGRSFTGVSGYRTPQHSVAVGGFADDPHTKGLAVDVSGGGICSIPAATLAKYGLVSGQTLWGDPHECNHIQLIG